MNAAARRSIKRRDWPRGLREPRPGYYAWGAPDGTIMGIGRVPLAVAKAEANAANLFVQQQRPTLVDRLSGADKTVGALIEAMPVPDNVNTAKSHRSLDKILRASLGSRSVTAVTVRDCAEMIEAQVTGGKARQAEALRSRLIALWRKAQAKGWTADNPAELTERPAVSVQRGRLTLEAFQAIHAVAGQVAEWLPHAMMLALVTGQDRSTVVAMERSHVADGVLTVWRSKTRKTNQPVAIPLTLRLDVVGVSLDELVKRRTGARLIVPPWSRLTRPPRPTLAPMQTVDLYRWHLTDPDSGRRYITRHRMSEADARAMDPEATSVPGSLERRIVPSGVDEHHLASAWMGQAPTA